MAHHRVQHFLGQAQELGVEAAEDGRRVLRHVRQPVYEAGVGPAPKVGSSQNAADALPDLVPPLLRRKQHVVPPQLLFVVTERDLDAGRAEHPVTAGGASRAYSRHLERHHLIAEQRHQPADGPDEARAALARPVHGLREVDAQDQFGQGRGQDLGRGLAGDGAAVAEVRAARRLAHFEIRDRRVALAREAEGRAGGLAVVESHRGGRAQHDLFGIGLAFGQAGGAQHQPPRRGIRFDAGGLDPVIRQQLVKQLPQVVEGGRDHPVGDFLDADLEQEGQRAHAATPASDCSSQAWATPTASLRTRPITATRSVTLMAPRESSRLNRCEHFSTWS